MPVHCFSTSDVHRHERFDYLDDLLRSRFFDMDVGIAAGLQPDFHAEAKLCANRHAVMIELDGTALEFDRARKNIERAPSGAFLLCRSKQGASSFTPEGSDAFINRPGDLTTGSADIAFRTAAIAGEEHRFRVLALPESRLDQIVGPQPPMPLRPLEATQGIYALLSTYYDALWREIDHLSAVQEAAAVDTIAQLVAIARGSLSPAHELAREGVREARRQLAREYIEANLHDPALSPVMAAATLKMSVRQLHLLFEPSGTSFTRYVQQRRLERARLLVLVEPPQPIIGIAFACGFESLTTFNRGFRLAFGLSPSELRDGDHS